LASASHATRDRYHKHTSPEFKKVYHGSESGEKRFTPVLASTNFPAYLTCGRTHQPVGIYQRKTAGLTGKIGMVHAKAKKTFLSSFSRDTMSTFSFPTSERMP
jgi:hypothetical protein